VAGFEAETVYGLLAPANTPRSILDKLNADVVKAVASPEMKQKLAEQGMTPKPSTSEEFSRYIKRDLAKYSKVVKDSGIQVDF
jgi:tripartite-type tricarboxylate transporter receptor subunit TctC